MRHSWSLLIILVLFACSGNESSDHSFLSQPPFVELTDSIQQAPQNAGLYYRRGVLLYQNNQRQYAEADIRKAWSLEGKEDYALSLVTVLKQKSPDSAILFLEEALKKLPGSIALQVGLARGYQNNGKKREALAVADKILTQYPGQIDALTLKSELLGENDKKSSLAYLERAYSLVPSDPSLAYDLAYEYADSKNSKLIHLTDSLIKAKAPEFEKAYYVRAVYFTNIGNTAEAIKNFDETIRLNYNFLDAYRDKGQVLLDQKKYDAALKTFTLALKVAPANAEFYYLTAQAEEGLGKKEEAKLNYQRAYGLDKSMTEAKEAADRL